MATFVGEGVRKDELAALQFFHQAAQVGEVKAMYNLGLMPLASSSFYLRSARYDIYIIKKKNK